MKSILLLNRTLFLFFIILSYDDLKRKINISFSEPICSCTRVNQYEKGKHVPDYSTIQRFSKALKVPACYFYAEDNYIAYMNRTFGDLSQQERAIVTKKIKKL